ncbi:hypothetical protein ACFPK9_08325 [Rubritalea spongiae]|uniref:Lipoprotein n=1 Tax=Rubritalea spongiae TaxID=430797 RepID=A0ABW5E3P0_9BACT
MKHILILLAGSCFALQSCMTTYDANGRPVQSVDPGLAAVGIVGAGLIGAAIASDNNDHHHSKPKPRPPHRDRDHHGGHGRHDGGGGHRGDHRR